MEVYETAGDDLTSVTTLEHRRRSWQRVLIGVLLFLLAVFAFWIVEHCVNKKGAKASIAIRRCRSSTSPNSRSTPSWYAHHPKNSDGMRVLFDQGGPLPLRRHLHPHEVDTTAERGWSELDNGELLDQAEAAGYDALVTTDQNLKY